MMTVPEEKEEIKVENNKSADDSSRERRGEEGRK